MTKAVINKFVKTIKYLIILSSLFTLNVNSFDIDSLLVVSVGGEKAVKRLKTAKTISAYGLVDINGMIGNFVVHNVMPDKMYLELDFGDFRIAQGFDGITAWQRDRNGAINKLSGFEADELKSQTYLQTFSYLFDDRLPGGKEYMGIEEHEGESYHVILFTPFSNDTLTLYYNISSGLQELAISQLDNLEIISRQSDFRKVEGVLMPFQSITTATSAPIKTSFKADSMLIDRQVDLKIFSRPSIVKKDYYFPETVDSLTVSFEYINGHIYLPVSINGSGRLWFILDSGASSNMYHLPAILSLALPVVGSLPAKGIGDYEEVKLVKTDSLTIGSLKLFSQVGGALDLSGIGRHEIDGDPLGGVLGYDFLSRFPMLIDYSKKQLVIYNPEQFVVPDSGSEVQFELILQVPSLEANLVGIKGNFIIDLGNPFGLLVHPKFTTDNNLETRLDNLTELSGGVGGIGGVLEGKSAYAATFNFGGVNISDLRVILLETGAGISGSHEIAGNIGNIILSQFKLLLDYKNERMIFYENE